MEEIRYPIDCLFILQMNVSKHSVIAGEHTWRESRLVWRKLIRLSLYHEHT